MPGMVKNKTPAEQQIPAEQILREAKAARGGAYKAPPATITDQQELNEYPPAAAQEV
jgi:hypothetical protein